MAAAASNVLRATMSDLLTEGAILPNKTGREALAFPCRRGWGVYERLVLPWLLDLAMQNSRLVNYRQKTIRAAWGFVLEIGIGSGLNLPIYRAAVDGVCGIDPSPELLHRASRRIGDARVPVLLVRASLSSFPSATAYSIRS